MLLFLALLSTTVASKPAVLKLEEQMMRSYRKLDATSHEATKLIGNIDSLLAKYDCDREDKNCAAWKAGFMIDELEIGKVNCDKEDQTGLCNKARELLGDKDKQLSDTKIKVDLLAATEENADEEDDKYYNAIVEAMAAYVCFKEEGECDNLSEMVELLMKFEDVVKDKNNH